MLDLSYYVDALGDSIHKDIGKCRAAKSIKIYTNAYNPDRREEIDQAAIESRTGEDGDIRRLCDKLGTGYNQPPSTP